MGPLTLVAPMDKENVKSSLPSAVTPLAPQLQLSMEPTLFRGKYQRNNKRGGLKNLRCFPTCGATHRARGFCGRSILVTINTTEQEANQTTFDSTKILCVGEFTQADAENRFAVGASVPSKHLNNLKRSQDVPFRPLVVGERARGSNPLSFEFNRKRKGWHYGWSSNKHSCNTEHCFRVYVLQQLEDDIFRVLDTVSSSPFVLFCRRRRRFHMEPSAPEGPPASKRLKRSPQVKSEDLSATAECLVSLATVCKQLCQTGDRLADSTVQRPRELVMS